MDLHAFGTDFSDAGAWVPGGLWRAVATCGGLWQQAVAPIYYHPQALRLAGWLDGWMAGWLDGRLAGWLDRGGGHHSCNLARSTPRRVGGLPG